MMRSLPGSAARTAGAGKTAAAAKSAVETAAARSAAALTERESLACIDQLGFEERLGCSSNARHSKRDSRVFTALLLRRASLRFANAVPEGIDYRTARSGPHIGGPCVDGPMDTGKGKRQPGRAHRAGQELVGVRGAFWSITLAATGIREAICA